MGEAPMPRFKAANSLEPDLAAGDLDAERVGAFGDRHLAGVDLTRNAGKDRVPVGRGEGEGERALRVPGFEPPKLPANITFQRTARAVDEVDAQGLVQAGR